MDAKGRAVEKIENEMIKCELIDGLQHAIDQNYRRLLESAKAQWERNFAGNDPSDACARIRVTTIEAVTKQAKSSHGANGKFLLPRLA
jgi:hypothetical protein